jgi:hypothetical protein
MKKCVLKQEGRPINEKIDDLAVEVEHLLDRDHVKNEIRRVHVHGGKSTQIQAILSKGLVDIGFQSERAGLFKQNQLRPDLYYKGDDFGILLEVERGKTLANNMDLLDLWKTHICEVADVLILVVPIERQRKNRNPEVIFDRVVARIQTFFENRNYTNVIACYIFGY